MIYEMKLNKEPFDAIKKGLKRVEMRLWDEKRRGILTGDQILFTQRESNCTVLARVVGLKKFNSFEELYAAYDKCVLGYEENEAAQPSDMSRYYSKEEIEKYGTLAIEIEVINK